MPEVIWEATLDRIFKCTVRRESEYVGVLTIDGQTERLLSEKVMLAYGAQFGPDLEDVQKWQDRCCEVIDNV